MLILPLSPLLKRLLCPHPLLGGQNRLCAHHRLECFFIRRGYQTSSSFSYAAPSLPSLLPLGCSVPTRYGAVKTDFMLFIASGAFHNKSPSDLLPELQGRFPVRVALQPLNKEDLIQILSAKKFNLLEQTKQLLATEEVELEFTACGVEVRADAS